MKTNGKWQTIPLLKVALFLITGMLISAYLLRFIVIEILFILFALAFILTVLSYRRRVLQSVLLSVTIILFGAVRMGIVQTEHADAYTQSSGVSCFQATSQRILLLRERLLFQYEEYDFSEEQLTLIYAITLGDKSLLTKEIRNGFSISGSSHVLALSGLHAGIVFTLFYLLFRCLFFFIQRYQSRESMTLLCTLPSIWFFALLTGSSPSVIRATVMLSVYSLARLLSREGVSLNVLSFAAIIMLVINPLDLYDIGFQLSFLAVFAILVVYKKCVNIFQNISNPIIKWMWQMFVLSSAAQLGTAPLAAFYFHQFSLMYFLSNMIIIPCVTLFLYLSIFFLLFSLCPLLQGCIAVTMKWTLSVMQGYNDWCASLPHPVIKDIHWTVGQLLAVYGLIISVFLIIRFLTLLKGVKE
ncbi:MAG: ComEC/Rec2 family competence protein [Prevotella sp.]|nr:ComEC/Rec2 family competence protein [Prevotella sp.]